MKFPWAERAQIYNEIESYLRQKQRYRYSVEGERYDLHEFVKVAKISQIKDLTLPNLQKYSLHIQLSRASTHGKIEAYKNLRCLMRYYYQRRVIHISPEAVGKDGVEIVGETEYNKSMRVRMKPGPQPNYKRDEKVFVLKNKGLSFRKIADELGENVKTTYTRYIRYKTTVGKLSTD